MDSNFYKKALDRINRIIRILNFRLSRRKPENIIACGEKSLYYLSLYEIK
jgi:hypothetical protein